MPFFWTNFNFMFEDHPIFKESIQYIRTEIGPHQFNNLEKEVLERLIHTSGDFHIKSLLKFSKDACEVAIKALRLGAPILTDTEMAAAGIKSMAKKTHNNLVLPVGKWFNSDAQYKTTKTAYCVEQAWLELSQKFVKDRSPIVVFGSSPTALEKLMDILDDSKDKPTLVVGMPVGFIGVERSKIRLLESLYNYIVVDSTRGGAAMAAATVNALLRSSI